MLFFPFLCLLEGFSPGLTGRFLNMTLNALVLFSLYSFRNSGSCFFFSGTANTCWQRSSVDKKCLQLQRYDNSVFCFTVKLLSNSVTQKVAFSRASTWYLSKIIFACAQISLTTVWGSSVKSHPLSETERWDLACVWTAGCFSVLPLLRIMKRVTWVKQ